MKYPVLVALALFLLCLGSFLWIMTHERRSLRSGFTLVLTLMSFNLFAIVVLFEIAEHDPHYKNWLLPLLIIILLTVITATLLFIIVLVVMLIYNGIKIIRREGNRWENYLSLCLGIAIPLFLIAYPLLGRLSQHSWLIYPYIFITLVVFYLIIIMMMYTLTSWLNLINWRHPHLDYIVVLGAGLNGKKVTPLLAARIKRGIAVMQNNPGAKLILSGGQGPHEVIPESEAMANYARELGVPENKIIIENKSRTTKENLQFSHQLMQPNSKFCIVTNSYHVYRALVLAKRQGLKCIGYGAKTKWYFTLNAFVREFIAYLVITRRLQITVISVIALFTLTVAIFRF